jgi:YggT family protein
MNTLINLILNAKDLYYYAIIIYIVMSWFPNAYGTAFHRFLHRICEPYLAIFRRIVPPIARIDFSPIIGLFALEFATKGLIIILVRFF